MIIGPNEISCNNMLIINYNVYGQLCSEMNDYKL